VAASFWPKAAEEARRGEPSVKGATGSRLCELQPV